MATTSAKRAALEAARRGGDCEQAAGRRRYANAIAAGVVTARAARALADSARRRLNLDLTAYLHEAGGRNPKTVADEL